MTYKIISTPETEKDIITIVAVFHTSQNPEKWKNR